MMLGLPSPWVVVYHVGVVFTFVLNTALLIKRCGSMSFLIGDNLPINPSVAVVDKVVT